MSSARLIHNEVCELLLASLESLQQAHTQFLDLVHPTNSSVERIKAKIKAVDCHQRLKQLSELVKVCLRFIDRLHQEARYISRAL